MERLVLQPLTEASFAPYGKLIRHTFEKPTGRDFKAVYETESTGWCLGILELERGVVPYMERHLFSPETHEPLQGVAALLVALPNTPDKLEAFLLDEPVLLHAGIWHQAAAISQTAVLKVVENKDVPPEESENRKLPGTVQFHVSI